MDRHGLIFVIVLSVIVWFVALDGYDGADGEVCDHRMGCRYGH